MPRVEKRIDISTQHLRNIDCFTAGGHELIKIPKDATNARLIVEWDDPPVDDWTPAKAALYMWNCLNMTREEIANKIAELERAACAEIATKAIEFYTQAHTFEAAGIIKEIREEIRARTNEKAGYPRMEK